MHGRHPKLTSTDTLVPYTMFCRSVHMLCDPTCGGRAAVRNEIALASGVGVRIRERDLPIRAEVAGACELLGLDPLYVANEGKLVAMLPPQSAAAALAALRAHPLGHDAAIIGVAREDRKIGRAHVWTPGTNAQRACHLLLEKKQNHNAKTQRLSTK